MVACGAIARGVAGVAILVPVLMIGKPAAGQVAETDQRPAISSPFTTQFGHAVAISGSRMVCGAPWDAPLGKSRTGAAYIYELDTAGQWGMVATLIASDQCSTVEFGWSVDVAGDYVVVGSTSERAYVFERQANGSWSEVARLAPPDLQPNQGGGFTRAVAIDGDLIAAGAPGEGLYTNRPPYAGAVYLFRRQGGPSWTFEAKLVATDAHRPQSLGYSVAVCGNRVLAGATGDTDNGSNAGAAYVFERNGLIWTEFAKLKPRDGRPGEAFGWAVDLSSTRAVCGAPSRRINGVAQGVAFVFDGGTQGFSEAATLSRPNGRGAFGRGVQIEGDRVAVVDASERDPSRPYRGYTYLFDRRPDGSWSRTVRIGLANGFAEGTAGPFHAALSSRHLLVSEQEAFGSVDLQPLLRGRVRLSYRGGAQDLLIRAGHPRAGDGYRVIGSLSGTSPGIALPGTPWVVPLNYDAYFFTLFFFNGAGVVTNASGVLDADGAADAAVHVPSGLPPTVIGATVHHAVVTLDSAQNPTAVTNAVAITLVP